MSRSTDAGDSAPNPGSDRRQPFRVACSQFEPGTEIVELARLSDDHVPGEGDGAAAIGLRSEGLEGEGP